MTMTAISVEIMMPFILYLLLFWLVMFVWLVSVVIVVVVVVLFLNLCCEIIVKSFVDCIIFWPPGLGWVGVLVQLKHAASRFGE